MTPKKFTRYMLVAGAGTNAKFARLSDGERCAHFLGVLSIASQSTIRGCLLVGDQEAGPAEVALEAGVSKRVAAAALEKLKTNGVLRRNSGLDCWEVHDWNDVNPEPKADPTRNDRQARLRAKRAESNAQSNAACNAEVTVDVTPTEVEVEVEEQQPHVIEEQRTEVAEVFDAWVAATERDATRTKLTADRRRRIKKAVDDHGLEACLLAVKNIGADAWARGANDRGQRFDDIEHALSSAARVERWSGPQKAPPAPTNLKDYSERFNALQAKARGIA